MINTTERTRTELLANRRRYQREGISIMPGPRDTTHVLPIASRSSIPVRSGFHPSEYEPSWSEIAISWSFEHLGWVLYPVLLVLCATLVVAQIHHHFAK